MKTPTTSYLITASPRCGSQLLASLLANTGLAGFPDEIFNPWHMGDATNFFPADLVYDSEHVRGLVTKHTTPNGVFGSKAHFFQVTNFVGLDRLEGLYPTPLKYIALSRRVTERQAVSLARAEQTNAFNSEMESTREPHYNFFQILQCAREIRVQTKGWEMYFMQREISPCRVVYEDLVADQKGTIRRVLEYLNIQVPDDFACPETHLEKQADELSEEWVEKFKSGVV